MGRINFLISFNFLQCISEVIATKSQSVCFGDGTTVAEPKKNNIFVYDIGFVDGAFIGELPRESTQNLFNTVLWLRYDFPICYVFSTNGLFRTYLFPFCDHNVNRTRNL